MTKSRQIGFIGLGKMGSGMALHLLKNTGGLFVYDSNPDALTSLADQGATGCMSPAAVASHCDIVFMCLPSTPEVQETIFGSNGISKSDRKAITIIDTTTLDRNDAVTLASETQKSGIEYCDCPVSGLPARAQDASLTVMFGGNRKVFDEVYEYLNHFKTELTREQQLSALEKPFIILRVRLVQIAILAR